MVKTESKGSFVIVISFVIAMFMNVLPLWETLEIFKPDWVALVLVYWVMAMPNRGGVLFGWIVGLFVDVLYGSLLGIHAMTFALVAYLIQMTYHRLRLFPRWKQAINITVVIGIHMLLGLILRGFVQPVSTTFTYWLPLVGSLLLWPWVFALLRDVRRKFCED
ncbi:MAG: rod shape-determining protein MreD [Kangiellaceae bacterium]|nr:rod shape-determining protein MreD [Kangiellaceae bacterium]